jgi:hypothetical protein
MMPVGDRSARQPAQAGGLSREGHRSARQRAQAGGLL